MDLLDALRLVFGAAVLTYAARSDWRTREVRDRAWILLGSVGLILFGYELVRDAIEAIIALALVPAVVLFYGVFFGEDFVTETGWRFPPTRRTSTCRFSVGPNSPAVFRNSTASARACASSSSARVRRSTTT